MSPLYTQTIIFTEKFGYYTDFLHFLVRLVYKSLINVQDAGTYPHVARRFAYIPDIYDYIRLQKFITRLPAFLKFTLHF